MSYSLALLIMAVVAGVLGFGVVPFAAAEIARICFYTFVILFLVSLILDLFLAWLDRWIRAADGLSASPLRSASCQRELSRIFGELRQDAPSVGDFIVIPDPDGYAVSVKPTQVSVLKRTSGLG
jgi:uncharacterized membrane protein YtjA (UPF0391 family)